MVRLIKNSGTEVEVEQFRRHYSSSPHSQSSQLTIDLRLKGHGKLIKNSGTEVEKDTAVVIISHHHRIVKIKKEDTP